MLALSPQEHDDLMKALVSPEYERLFALNQPSLRALSCILRHRELWPKGFVWEYNDCQHCAMGLAAKLWNLGLYYDAECVWLPKTGMPVVAIHSIFRGSSGDDERGLPIPAPWVAAAGGWKAVTPEMVADQIDRYVAGGSDAR